MKIVNAIFILSLLLFSCKQSNKVEHQHYDEFAIKLDKQKALYLYHFAYDCIDKEYPNKPGHVLGDESYLATPSELHPAFYGCFDWHSSVHGHWTLVSILSHITDFEYKDEIIAKLQKNISEVNIQKEIAYFNDEHNKNFERTYGWAWLLKLDEALQKWDSPAAKEMHNSLKPLVDVIADKFILFLDKLIYPIRVGEHPNTAFGMSFAYDYAKKYNSELASKIEIKAKEYYLNDSNAPISWEPGGFDFLSPSLQEASLMQKVLTKDDFKNWINCFIPGFLANPEEYIKPAVVTDRSDGKLAHLDGLNFSRAWCLYELAYGLNNLSLQKLAKQHFDYSYQQMDSGEYAGAHWLASFATYALLKGQVP